MSEFQNVPPVDCRLERLRAQRLDRIRSIYLAENLRRSANNPRAVAFRRCASNAMPWLMLAILFAGAFAWFFWMGGKFQR